jgi:hypothetical protein
VPWPTVKMASNCRCRRGAHEESAVCTAKHGIYEEELPKGITCCSRLKVDRHALM